ncbi:MAG: type II toxin-antitoxin system VapB family antitoxin [Phaeodactylibacter sp.]|nr:type II toxin-antitoxin system VapB family antitoxin [Phaeodactylibacter sp.]
MQTSIKIDDQLMDAALELSGLKSTKAVVEEALKIFVQMLQQKSIQELRGKLKWKGDMEQTHNSNVHP